MRSNLEKAFEEATQLPEAEQDHLANELSKLIAFARFESKDKEGELFSFLSNEGLIEEEMTCLGMICSISEEECPLICIELLDGQTVCKRVQKEVGTNLKKWNQQWVDATGIAKRKPESMEIEDFELVKVSLNRRGEELASDYWATKDNASRYETLEEEGADEFIKSL